MSVQSSVFAKQRPLFYKPLFIGSERPPLANNWHLDCSLSVWRVNWDRLLWKGQSIAVSAGDGKKGKGEHGGIKTGNRMKIKRIRLLQE